MSLAVQIEPGTGRKIFNTRAAKATDKIAGKGYSVIEDKALVTLPDPPPGAVFNAEEQAKLTTPQKAEPLAKEAFAAKPTLSKMAAAVIVKLNENEYQNQG